ALLRLARWHAALAIGTGSVSRRGSPLAAERVDPAPSVSEPIFCRGHMSSSTPSAIAGFKAYDYRGRIPAELNPEVAYRIGRAYAQFLKPRRVVVGRDIRLSSDEL